MLERLRRRRHAVELDLSAVTFMDSTGLTTLMEARLAAERNGGSFAIARASTAVRRVFELAGVDRLLAG